MGCSRQEYWSVFPCPLPGSLPEPGFASESHWQVGSLPLGPPGTGIYIQFNVLFTNDSVRGNRLIETAHPGQAP